MRPYKKYDMVPLMDEPHNRALSKFTDEQYAHIESTGLNKSFFTEEGKLLMCGGVSLYWAQRGEAWAVFTGDCRKEFMELHSAAKKYLYSLKIKRIEAAIYNDFIPGCRWIKALGFKMDAPLLKNYYPDGRDTSLYSLVREV